MIKFHLAKLDKDNSGLCMSWVSMCNTGKYRNDEQNIRKEAGGCRKQGTLVKEHKLPTLRMGLRMW